MKKIILICCGVLLANCSTGPRTSLNCEKLHLDSEARLQELRHIFASYQGVNYDLAMKLAGPLREEVGDLDARVRKQKQKCWSSEKRPIDAEMALLKDELFKVYGKDDEEKTICRKIPIGGTTKSVSTKTRFNRFCCRLR
jgi:hypothetical protein